MRDELSTEADHPENKATGKSDPSDGRSRITINDIARLANVSKKTVSRVINDSPLVSDDTRDRVKEIIAEFGFRPDL